MPKLPHRNDDDSVEALKSQFEQLPQIEPSKELDDQILAMAKSAVAERKSRRDAHLIREHSGLITAAAAAVFAVGIVLTLSDPTREVRPSQRPAEQPLQLELAEPQADGFSVRERRLPAKASPATPPAQPQAGLYDTLATDEPATPEALAAPQAAELTAEPERVLVQPQAPQLGDRSQRDAASDREIEALRVSAERDSAPVRVRTLAPDPGSGPSTRPSRSRPPVLEEVSVGQPDTDSKAVQSEAPRGELPGYSELDSKETWESIVARARLARDAGDVEQLSQLLDLLSQRFPDRALPSDLKPLDAETGKNE